MPTASTPARHRWLWRAAAVLLLGLVFASYWMPETLIGLANQLWSCL